MHNNLIKIVYSVKPQFFVCVRTIKKHLENIVPTGIWPGPYKYGKRCVNPWKKQNVVA
jgi:hypothetical protein